MDIKIYLLKVKLIPSLTFLPVLQSLLSTVSVVHAAYCTWAAPFGQLERGSESTGAWLRRAATYTVCLDIFYSFTEKASEDLMVWVVGAIPRILRETFWIYTLDTLSPGSLNEVIEVNTVL